MMQTDEDVGKISQATPVMIGELLLLLLLHYLHHLCIQPVCSHLLPACSSCHGTIPPEAVPEFC